MSGKAKLVILGSGRGSNFESIVRACQSGRLDAQIVGVISNKAHALILDKAREHQIPSVLIESKKFPTLEAFEHQMVSAIQKWNPALICCAGYMKILGKVFLEAFEGMTLNIHPSLLPKFPGLHPQKKALQAGERQSGCTIHWVNAQVDGGQIVYQQACPIYEDDSVEKLTDRILQQEHEAYPKAIGLALKQLTLI